jgi:hypothetical protein
MLNRKKIALLVVLALIGLAGAAWHSRFGERVTAHVDSISPDGMFRCTVTEIVSNDHSTGEVVVFKRLESTHSSGEESWAEIQRVPFSSDSCTRAYYSIDWQYDGDYHTTRLTVFGNYSVPTLRGGYTILLERSFMPPTTKEAGG